MVSILQAIFLGIIQGITEWFPVSSSGHLVIFNKLLNIESTIFFDFILHMGTLISVMYYFRKDITEIMRSIIGVDLKTKHGKLAYYVLVGSIPIGIVGFFLNDYIDMLFSSIELVAIAMIVMGLVIYSTKGLKGKNHVSFKEAILIGIAQVFAIIPGISRSGSTISASKYFGIKTDEAIRFSFLLSIPAIVGASIATFFKSYTIEPLNILLIGFFVSAVVGYVVLKTVVKLIEDDKFHWFSYYLIPLGLLLLVWSLF